MKAEAAPWLLSVISAVLAVLSPLILILQIEAGQPDLYFEATDYNTWNATVILFRTSNIYIENGTLALNPYKRNVVGRVLYRNPIPMINTTTGKLSSFNTSFVFSVARKASPDSCGDGMAFFMSPSLEKGTGGTGGHLGMFNTANNGKASNNVFAVEFDTHRNPHFKDPNDNHVGVDVNGIISKKTATPPFRLDGGQRIVCWIDYDGDSKYLRVYLANYTTVKPKKPVIKMLLDLKPILKAQMYAGFSAATGQKSELHTVHSWWFMSGYSAPLQLAAPVSAPSSAQAPAVDVDGDYGDYTGDSDGPFPELGSKPAVIGTFTAAGVAVALCFTALLVYLHWKRIRYELIQLLRPLASWAFFKNGPTNQWRSRSFRLAAPAVELFAWLWRTRFLRRRRGPRRRQRVVKLIKSMRPRVDVLRRQRVVRFVKSMQPKVDTWRRRRREADADRWPATTREVMIVRKATERDLAAGAALVDVDDGEMRSDQDSNRRGSLFFFGMNDDSIVEYNSG